MTPSLAVARRVLADQSVTRMLGTRLVSFGEGSAVVELDVRPEITNHHGAVHGGIIAYAADTALAFAGGAALGPDVVTSGLSIDYLAPARGVTLRAHGMVLSSSGRRAACRCELHTIDEEGVATLVAVAQGTIAAPSPPSPSSSSPARTTFSPDFSDKSPAAARRLPRQPTVHEVLLERRRTGNLDDGATVALVVEGGGMRGIVSAAMAAVLEQEGVLPTIDLIVGTSAGAVNAAALAVGNASAMADSYAEVFSSPEFIDVRRIARGRPVIDGARIVGRVDELFGVSAAAASPWRNRLAMVATDVDTGRAAALTDFADRADLIGSIHASGLLPMLAGEPVTLRGRRWLDGGIVEAVPVLTAASLGATHAIVLATRPPGTQPAYGATDVVAERYLRRLNPELAAAYRGRPHRYRETLQQVRDGRCHGVSTVALTPRTNDPLPSRLERDQTALRAARAAAAEAARQQLAFLLS
ncbi:patatin-like phospholipase family protein [Actinoplanes sp. NPDC023714]|uniref:patatin-like phospholipase family protein n=1 Tax=Actinoplanes sp. NPDC023714 TaxID=3154322 RepID=UPI0033F587D4